MSEQQQPVFQIMKLYVKDLSLEVPNAPKIFLERDTPQLGLEIGTRHEQLEAGVFHVELKLTVTTKFGDKTLFLAEVVQCGIFQLRGIPESELETILSTLCPNILFPYGREVISDLTGRTGFPQPVVLEPIDFNVLYAQRQQQAAAANDAPATVQ